MNNKFYKTLLINLFVTVSTSLGAFIINKYFVQYLGIEKLGLMKLFSQLLAYLNFAELGLVSASAYALYKPLLEKDEYKISIIMNTISSLYNKICFFILIVGILLNPIVPFFIKEKIDSSVYLYWSLYVINSALSYTFVKYSVLFTADQNYYLVRIIQGISRICSQVLQLFSIIYLKSFLVFILFLIFENILQFIFFQFYYRKKYRYIFKTSEKDRTIVKNLKNLFWHKLAGLVVFNTDLILISKFISLNIVGIYGSYLMITQIIIIFVNIILNVLQPIIGRFIAKNSKENIFNFWKELNILFLFLSIFFTGGTFISINSFVKLWLGDKYILPVLTVALIMVNLFTQCFRGMIDTFKDGSGFFDDIHLPILEAIINFIFSIILLQFWGLNGVIIGTICSNISIVLIAKPILVFKKCFDKKTIDYIKIYLEYLLLIVISVIFINLIKSKFNFINIFSWKEWIIQVLFFSIIYLPMLALIFLINKDFRKGVLKLFAYFSNRVDKKS